MYVPELNCEINCSEGHRGDLQDAVALMKKENEPNNFRLLKYSYSYSTLLY